MATELLDEAPVTRIAPEDIAKERAQAPAAPAPVADPADAPIPPSEPFNEMARKLEELLKETKDATPPPAPKSTAPDPNDKVQTDSRKPAPKEPTTAPKEPPKEPEVITSPKAADWKAIKEKKEAAEKEAADLRQRQDALTKEIAELKAKPILDPVAIETAKKERDAIVAERDKLRDQLEVVALERSEKFTTFYEKKFNQAVKQAQDAAGEEHAAAIAELMQLPPSKARKERINAIREELIGMDQGQLDQAVVNYDAARVEREEQLKNSKENYKKLVEIEQNNALTAKQEADKQAEAAMIQVLSLAKEVESFKAGENPEQAAFAAESEAFVRKFFTKQLTQSEIALLPVLARQAKYYESKIVPALQSKIKEMEIALTQYQQASPRPSGGPPATSPKGQSQSFIERFNEAWPAGNR